ncbi:diaminopimelate epimerase [Desulfocucumis palustris]|uniref:Diaminopimelate epimerase n=1 Tax=Desulfocucumis palustris TaxID=1898651 RepID=A0A2L2X8K7_9FIRM|nr:diaminopimelate epimerase [Desulfocucumis palustris]
MIAIKFVKFHGLGNDFVIVDALEESGLPENREELPGLARDVCHRRFGVGADGLILIKKSDKADIYMQIINSDGSEPEMCGNGIRCVAKYVYDAGIVPRRQIRVETLAGIILPEIITDDHKAAMVKVDMGQPGLERSDIPMLGPAGRVVGEPLEHRGEIFRVTAVSMGNPHCVIFVDDVQAVPLYQLGPELEVHPAFPRKANIEFVQVLNQGEVIMRVWERGAGYTMACGTGACAAGVASCLNGYTGRKVMVHLQAGPLEIEWSVNNHVYMTGPARKVFTGDYPLE